jgi:hypothetical protein
MVIRQDEDDIAGLSPREAFRDDGRRNRNHLGVKRRTAEEDAGYDQPPGDSEKQSRFSFRFHRD